MPIPTAVDETLLATEKHVMHVPVHSPLSFFAVAAVVQKIRGGVASRNGPAEEGGEGRLRPQTGRRPPPSVKLMKLNLYLATLPFQR
jgi:hypothetical protein